MTKDNTPTNPTEEQERFVPMGTKVSPSAAVVWDAICNALETDTYHMLQQFIYAMIRAASDQHNLSPEIQQLIDNLDFDAGWQTAMNLAAPNAEFDIAQMILILSQKGKRGFGAVMIDRPFMGHAQQTENVDQIYERLTEVIFRRHYLKLRQIGTDLGTHSVRQTLDTMIDAQTLLDLDDASREGPQMGDRTDYGRTAAAYGKRTKRKQHLTPDSPRFQQQTIHFQPDDVPDLPELHETLCGNCRHCDDNNPYGKTYCDRDDRPVSPEQKGCEHFEE